MERRAHNLKVVSADGDAPAPNLNVHTAYRQYYRYVAGIAFRILGRPQEVDDLVQDVFLQAHRRIHTVREPAALKGWLARITVNLATKRLRKRRFRATFRLDSSPSYLEAISPAASPEQRALLSQVYRVLDTVPTKDRVAWTLRFVEGESIPGIAKLCGCSISTTKRRVAAAAAIIEKRCT